MQLHLERPDYAFYLRGADGTSALVNDRTLRHSFCVSPDTLLEDWPWHDASTLPPEALDPLATCRRSRRRRRSPPRCAAASAWKR